MRAPMTGAVVAWAVLLAATPGRAEGPLFVHPNFQFEGKTDGEVNARATFGLRIANNDGPEWLLRANARVASKDGVATLLGFDKSGLSLGNDWQAGLSATYTVLDLNFESNEPDDRELVKAVDQCTAQCEKLGADKKFCEAKQDLVGREEAAWIHGLTLGKDLPFETSGVTVKRVSYAFKHLWSPSAEGVKAWRRPEAFCPAKRADARETYKKLDVFLADKTLSEEERKRKIRAAEGELSGLLEACFAPCKTDHLPTPEEWAFCVAEPVFVLPEEAKLDLRKSLCPAGQATYERNVRPHQLPEHPTTIVNFGVVAGQTYLSYLASNGAGVLTQQKNRSRPVVTVGASATHLFTGPVRTWTIEGRVGWSLDWDAGSKKVRWCTPTDPVQHGDPTRVDPGESCSEGVLGAPSRAAAFSAALYVGMLDSHQSVYRASLGIEAKVPPSDPSATQVAIAAPAYFVFTGKEKDAYKGLIRISPTLTFESKVDDNDASKRVIGATVGVTLTILGERLLFSEEFDKL